MRHIRALGGAVQFCVCVYIQSWCCMTFRSHVHIWDLPFGNMMPALHKRAMWVDLSVSLICRLICLFWLLLCGVHSVCLVTSVLTLL